MKPRERHGRSRTREHEIWKSMIQRCHNPRGKSFHDYGARGIVVCDEWRGSFMAFLRDMGPIPDGDYSIERKDNSRGYNPDNCVWATRDVQARNKRNNRVISCHGQTKTLAEWSQVTGINYRIIGRRLDRGWTPEDALGKPVRPTRFIVLSHNGMTMNLYAWSKFLGIGFSTLHRRAVAGWSADRILSEAK